MVSPRGIAGGIHLETRKLSSRMKYVNLKFARRLGNAYASVDSVEKFREVALTARRFQCSETLACFDAISVNLARTLDARSHLMPQFRRIDARSSLATISKVKFKMSRSRNLRARDRSDQSSPRTPWRRSNPRQRAQIFQSGNGSASVDTLAFELSLELLAAPVPPNGKQSKVSFNLADKPLQGRVTHMHRDYDVRPP